MSAIDRAFIKAYMLREGALKGVASESSNLGQGASGSPAWGGARDLDSGQVTAEADGTVTDLPIDPRAESEVEAGPGSCLGEAVETCEGLSRPQAEPWLGELGELPEHQDGEAGGSTLSPSDAIPSLDAAAVFAEVTPSDSAQSVFLPSFQVESFAWPSGPTRLSMLASDQVDQLADALAAERDRRQQVVAIAGCRRGDGCTTLLLCVARRLAERGLKVAMLDADLANPLLARRLGLAPELGWEEVLAGRLPAHEVAIESLQERLTVLPWSGSPTRPDQPADVPDLAASLNVLREHYDLVLVDLGEFGAGKGGPNGLVEALLHWIDAVVLVHNVRSTPQAELNRTRWRVQAAGLVEAGITQNFVEIRQSA